MCPVSAVTASCSRARAVGFLFGRGDLSVDGGEQQHRQRRDEHERVEGVAPEPPLPARFVVRDEALRRRAGRDEIRDHHRDEAAQNDLQGDREDALPQVADAVEARDRDQRRGDRRPDEHAATSGERPRRANAPTTSASMGRMAMAGLNAAGVDGNAAITAESAPNIGPKRIATGSVATRPKRSGAAVPMRQRFKAKPATPHATAKPNRRRDTRFIVAVIAAPGAAAPIVYSRAVHVLIAEDDRVTGEILARTLRRWTYSTTLVSDGAQAWEMLRAAPDPTLAILDWMMPGMDGPDVCRRARAELPLANMYLLLVTARESRGDVVAGLDAGADDYIIKPFDPEELRARVAVGARVLALQQKLAERVEELQTALSNVKQLRGLLPICSYCKRIRGDDQYWQQVEGYIAQHSDAQFSHGICPTCYATVSAEIDEISRKRQSPDKT